MASIDRRPGGKYRARWREFPGGPQRTKQFARKIDAERHLVDVQHRIMSGSYIQPEAARVTFAAFVDTYLARQPWRASTADKATEALGRARATFGDRPLGSAGGCEPVMTSVSRGCDSTTCATGFASALISAGCSVKAVQRALGHASASTTLDVYGHLWPGDEDRIRAAVDQALGPAEDQLRTVQPLR